MKTRLRSLVILSTALLLAAFCAEAPATHGQRAPYHPTHRLNFAPTVRAHGPQSAPGLYKGADGSYNAPGFTKQSWENETFHDGWLGDDAHIKDPFLGEGAQGYGATYRGRGGR